MESECEPSSVVGEFEVRFFFKIFPAVSAVIKVSRN